jgi:hypothetical protein
MDLFFLANIFSDANKLLTFVENVFTVNAIKARNCDCINLVLR